jgi:hypothetical protein
VLSSGRKLWYNVGSHSGSVELVAVQWENAMLLGKKLGSDTSWPVVPLTFSNLCAVFIEIVLTVWLIWDSIAGFLY